MRHDHLIRPVNDVFITPLWSYMGTAQIHQGQGMYIHTSFNAAFTLIRVKRCLLSKPFPEGTAPLYSLKHERKSCSGASQLEGCFSSVNIDKASMSYNQPTSYSV